MHPNIMKHRNVDKQVDGLRKGLRLCRDYHGTYADGTILLEAF
jgi:hypothetical protein